MVPTSGAPNRCALHRGIHWRKATGYKWVRRPRARGRGGARRRGGGWGADGGRRGSCQANALNRGIHWRIATGNEWVRSGRGEGGRPRAKGRGGTGRRWGGLRADGGCRGPCQASALNRGIHWRKATGEERRRWKAHATRERGRARERGGGWGADGGYRGPCEYNINATNDGRGGAGANFMTAWPTEWASLLFVYLCNANSANRHGMACIR